jgi:glycosyltransferase involved in cell wall biosynthesis
MNVLFLGLMYSQDKIGEYKINCKRGLQFAAQNLQESIIEGLLANGVEVTTIVKPVLSTFPKGYRYPYVRGCDFIFRGKNMGRSIGYFNLPLFNKPSKSEYLKLIEDWYYKTGSEKVMFVYALEARLMKIAVETKNKFPDITIIQIVPDLPRFVGCNKYYKKLGLKERDERMIYNLVGKFDRYVLLCKNMADDLRVDKKKCVVMEGIFSPEDTVSSTVKESQRVILYTGNLDARYGIINLLDAFSLIKDENFRLWIRGNGATEPIVRERMTKDSRISLIPQLSKAELLALERKATILVNPVSPKQEFTRFFFPSKTMDYLASGTPTLMFELECLPEEYKPHLFFFKEDTSEQMASDLCKYCCLSEKKLKEKGENASRFIMENKLSKMQVKRILDII